MQAISQNRPRRHSSRGMSGGLFPLLAAMLLSDSAAAATLSNIQYSATGGASAYNGSRVIVTGVTTYADAWGYGLSDSNGGPWSGVYVFDPFHRPNPGDRVRLEGLVQEPRGMTVLTNVALYSVQATNQAVPATLIRGRQMTNEAYEGVFIRITNITVRNVNVGGTRTYWQARDSETNFLVGTRAPYRYIWVSNNVLESMQGMVFSFGGTNSVMPRFDEDLAGRTVFEYALRGMVITPAGPRTNWYVHVRDDDLVAVTSTAPVGVTVADTGGIIFPGLLDVHNHPAYNSFPTLMFHNFPYGHRDEWGEADAEYDDWKTQRNSLRTAVNDSNTDLITKYGECLELMAGCVAIQGQSNSDAEHSHPAVILYNLEQFPARTWCNIFPTNTTLATRTNLLTRIAGGAVNSTIVHISEGPDAVSLSQFTKWRDWGMLNETVAIIHGTALGPTEFSQMAAAGAKLLWSPMSNMKLYGATANVRAAKGAGVCIGLSPDWTPSGCYNILEELGYAWELNQTLYTNTFTARELCDMVTINNARCAGLESRYGKIAAGYNAGLVVIEGDPADPYLSLIRARPYTVKLTVVDGTPRYGDPDLMSALGVSGEHVDVRGRTKVFNIAVNHPFLDYGHYTFGMIQTNLRAGHLTLAPINELDRDELQFLDVAFLQRGPDDVQPFRADNPLQSGPGSGVYDLGSNLSLAFRYQDFWDNDTFVTDLVHTIYIVPGRYSNLVLQTVAENWPNDPAHTNVNFTVDFRDMHTNYIFCFVTADRQGNSRTSLISAVSFKLAAHEGGDSDRDGLPNEWETTYFGFFTNATASANPDGDILNNLEEYLADTVPTNFASCYSTVIGNLAAAGGGTMQIRSPAPTSPQRVYDLLWTTNLTGDVTWTAIGLRRPGAADRSAIILTVTNDRPSAVYRVGVGLP